MHTGSVSLSADDLREIFPFHFVLNRDLRFVQLGRAWSKLGSRVREGERLDTCFTIVRPAIDLDFVSLSRHCGRVCVFRCSELELVVRGQLRAAPEADGLLFLGNPWIRDLDQLKRFGFTLDDLPAQEAASEYLFLIQAQRRAIGEARDLAAGLERREGTLRAILNTAAEGIITADTHGIIQTFNAAASRIFGYDADEMIGQNLSTLMPEPHAGRHDSYLKAYLRGGPPHVIGRGREVEGLKKDGSVVPLDLAVSEVGSGDDRIFTGIIRDLTEYRKTEAALRQAKDEAEQAARVRASFLATMSHEIRTPLNGVIGMLNILRQTPVTEEQIEHLDAARRSADLLLAVTNDVLDVSRIEAGGLAIEVLPFRLRPMVDDVVATIRPQARPGVEVVATIPASVPDRLQGDPTRLRQALTNVMGNAVKFTQKGAVRLGVTSTVERGGPGREEAVRVRFRVEDTGIGIPADKRDTIFEAFAQADHSTTRRFGGTGLGLSIAASLAQLMNGTLRLVQSSPSGSVFEMELVLPLARMEPARRTDAPQPKVSGHVLLVDDNEINRRVAAIMLRHVGCTVDMAEDGVEALARIREKRYDLVLMDCQMPELDGYEATRAARGEGFTADVLPIIAMTASALPEDRARSIDAGMNDHLSKPLLEAALRATLAKWIKQAPGAPSSTC